MMIDRRSVIGGALGTTVAIAAAKVMAEAKPSLSGTELLDSMSWFNPPASVKQSGARLVVRSRPKTDFWRKTFYGYITDNGHFLRVPVEGDFTFQVRVNGAYAAQYDQAGIMVRLDEQQWMKCGSELVDGGRFASVVFTRDFSDWSTLPDLSQSRSVWWRVARKKDSIEASCSADGSEFLVVRQGYFPPEARASVGVMCCAPEGSGFDATFDELRLDRSA